MMKTLLLFLLLMGVLLKVNAQIDYVFSSFPGTYASLTAATTAPLTASYLSTGTVLDESFANDIPIGFTFQYNGVDYTKIHLNANGFAVLGNSFQANSSLNPSYDVNELRSATGLKGAIRPILAPFWDNLLFSNANNLSYKTEGVAPNRIFTVQWQNMIWQSGTAAISFQMKLYESSGVIEFLYQQSTGTAGASATASIGITAQNVTATNAEIDLGNFISLNNSSSNPSFSKIVETDNISTKPATNQGYRFTPSTCASPNGLKIKYLTNNTASIEWTALKNVTSYEYALGNYEVLPTSWTVITTNSVSFTELKPNTQYFFYIRNPCGSDARLFRFKTPTTASMPFTEGFENSIDNRIPAQMLSQNLSDDFADIFWQTSQYTTPATGGSKAAVNASPFANAQTWLYTPGFALEQGKSYKLRFKYATSGGTQGLEIKYGQKIGQEMMSNQVFSNSNIANTSYKDTTVTFSPPLTSVYYIGFLYKSSVNNNLFLLDDISMNSAVFPCNDNPTLPNYTVGTNTHIKVTNFINATNSINAGTDILYQAGKYIDLKTNFEAKTGAIFKAQIGGCN